MHTSPGVPRAGDIAEPKLDFDLLAEIRRRTEVPLVLHGGSGIPVDQVQKAIGMGVAKMNVGTAIHVAFKDGMQEGLAARRPAPVRRHHHVRRTRCITLLDSNGWTHRGRNLRDQPERWGLTGASTFLRAQKP
jgi:fructose/tagatose bisphosphate aldolase